jgi:acyl-CoA synthetase (AMP-forming)/AMP-acid ligase II/acyl carrier protein
MTVQLLPDVLANRARDVPDALALLVDGGGELSFRRWEDQSNAFARGLAAHDVSVRSRLGLLFGNENLDECAIAYLGALKAGAAVVPLAPSWPRAEQEQAIAGAGAGTVVYAAGHDHPDLTSPALTFSTICRGQDVAPYRAPIGPDDLAEVICTSGTAGQRREVLATHGNIAADWVEEEASDQERYFLHAMPPGTNAAQVALRGALRWPPTTLVLPDYDPVRLCELIESYGVTSVLLVPAMALYLIASEQHQRFDLSCVRTVIVTAAAMPPAAFGRLTEIFPNAALHNAYSCTQSWPARTDMRYDPRRPGALGRPLAGGQVRVTGPTGEPLPPGTAGDIWLHAPKGIPPRRYLREVPNEDMFRDDWARTGDVGHLDTDGYLYLTGRDIDLINTGGFSVSALEVEAVLHEHPAVIEAAVVGFPDEVLGQALGTVVVTTGEVTPARLRGFAAERLPAHKVPARVAVVSALPRNHAWKVVKGEVRRLLLGRRDGGDQAAGPSPLPRAGLEAVIARLWREVLGGQARLADDFFQAGGNSLVAMHLIAMIQQETGVRLTMRDLFDDPTVAGTAAAVARQRDAGAVSEGVDQ